MTATQRTLRLGRPLWLRSSRGRQRQYASLSGSHQTTVAIVGGGITGALIAQAFAAAGVATTVLEAARVGRGSTAASSALLLQEPDRSLVELTARYGPAASRRIWQIGQESVRAFISLVRRLRIGCDLTQRDAVFYATGAAALEDLRREYTLRRRLGFDARWLSAGELRRLTGIAGPGAIRTRGSAQFDPYRACLGVLRSAVAHGAEVFERAEVRRIAARGDGVRLHTASGVVTAQRVIIATGYATARFRPLAGRFRLDRTYVLATEPLRAAERREVGLGDVMVWDTERPYHYARWTADHRLLLGGGDRRIVAGQRRRQQFEQATHDVRAAFEARLPALAAVKTATAWEGVFAMTPDSLPYIGPHRRYPGHWFALGYGGNGTTFAYLAARLLLELAGPRVARPCLLRLRPLPEAPLSHCAAAGAGATARSAGERGVAECRHPTPQRWRWRRPAGAVPRKGSVGLGRLRGKIAPDLFGTANAKSFGAGRVR